MYDAETANLETMIYDDEEVVGLEPEAASRWQFIWLCGLILSFCYELPLAQLTTMQRLNPRFFDIVFLFVLFRLTEISQFVTRDS